MIRRYANIGPSLPLAGDGNYVTYADCLALVEKAYREGHMTAHPDALYPRYDEFEQTPSWENSEIRKEVMGMSKPIWDYRGSGQWVLTRMAGNIPLTFAHIDGKFNPDGTTWFEYDVYHEDGKKTYATPASTLELAKELVAKALGLEGRE